MSHTPTPWIEAGPSFGALKPRYINEIVSISDDEDDSWITICFMNEFSLDNETNAANAAHIVKCVNGYAELERQRDELLEALKSVLNVSLSYIPSDAVYEFESGRVVDVKELLEKAQIKLNANKHCNNL